METKTEKAREGGEEEGGRDGGREREREREREIFSMILSWNPEVVYIICWEFWI